MIDRTKREKSPLITTGSGTEHSFYVSLCFSCFLLAFTGLLSLSFDANVGIHVTKHLKIQKSFSSSPKPLVSRHIVVESLFDWRSVAEVAPVAPFHGLTQDVSRGVPEHHLALVVVKLDQGQGGGLLERTVEVPKLAVDLTKR